MSCTHSLVLAALLASACASKAEVGEACDTNTACASDRCVQGGTFPGGLCTEACTTSADCPAGWSCMSRSGGICLRDCATASECQAAHGNAWTCDEQSLLGGGGERRVCIGTGG